MNFPTNQRKYFWKKLRRHLRVSVADARENNRWLRSGPRILIARHAGQKPYTQHYYLNWLAQEFPELRSLFELRLLPCKVRNWSRYRLYIPWFPDSAIDWMAPATYARALDLEAECEARGIPVINSVAHTPNRIRTVACVRLAAEGIRTPARRAHFQSATIPLRSLRIEFARNRAR